MSRRFLLTITMLLWTLLPSAPLMADAIVVSQAMFASTIAEYFVEEDHVRVELEIGMDDIASFRNLLPDAIHQELGFGDVPIDDRMDLFFGRDLAIYAAGAPLKGGVAKMGPETRVKRDPVTGDPLPQGEEEPEVVIKATLLFPFGERPESLSLAAPTATGMASIGFVLYHQGVAVNDFRFLSNGYTVNLDWEDPWYSAFDSRSLRRQYFSPMTGFIYVEPYEVRKEIIVRPSDIQRFHDLGLEGAKVITADMQDSVKAGIVEFLGEHFPLSIDGKSVEGTIDRVNFLQRSLRSSIVVDGSDIPLLPATVGVIYVFPTDGLPTTVELDWTLFTERMPVVPASAVDQAGPLPVYLEPEFSVLKWENFLKYPELPTLKDIREPPTVVQGLAYWGQAVFGVLAFLAMFLLIRSLLAGRGMNIPALASFVLATGIAGWSMHTWRQVQLDSGRLQALVGDLLHNVYRAFDYRGEEAVYDVLARSVTGDLLNDVYLEARKGLELANQGGARVKVKNIEMLEATLQDEESGALAIEARWNVMGSVGHWGHVHQRTNAYHANLELRDEGGAWKLTGLEILEEERL